MMTIEKQIDFFKSFVAFASVRMLASGSIVEVVSKVKSHLNGGNEENVTIFENRTGKAVDIDFRGSLEEVLERLPEEEYEEEATEELPKRSGPGRPKLGVISREVSLLPRHWEWLSSQPGSISGTLRKLVEKARKESVGKDRFRRIQQATHAFMWAMASDLPEFEEASRSFFASDYETFRGFMEAWPKDIREHVEQFLIHLIEAEKDL